MSISDSRYVTLVLIMLASAFAMNSTENPVTERVIAWLTAVAFVYVLRPEVIGYQRERVHRDRYALLEALNSHSWFRSRLAVQRLSVTHGVKFGPWLFPWACSSHQVSRWAEWWAAEIRTLESDESDGPLDEKT